MLLVDAYNVLHAAGVLPPHLRAIGLGGLTRLIGAGRYRARGARLVCDGRASAVALPDATTDRSRPGVHILNGCEVVFSGAASDADTLIERTLESDPAPGRFLVVSSDRRIVTAAVRARAATLNAAQFLLHLAEDERKAARDPRPAFTSQVPLDAYSIALWMREFGVSGADPGHADPGPAELAGRAAGHPVHQPRPTPAPAKPTPPVVSTTPSRQLGVEPGAPPGITDPLLIEALRHWDGRIRAEDLNMAAWLARETRAGREGDDR